MHPDKKEQLMKLESASDARNVATSLPRVNQPKQSLSIREATVEPPNNSKEKKKPLPEAPTEPPSYESLLKIINARTI